MTRYLLAIDQGTTSSRAVVYDDTGNPRGIGQAEFPQIFPANGWVEHDPETIWQTTLDSCQAALQQAGLSPGEVATIGITNQRETTLLWDRTTGRCLHNAIVWQDRRTADYCQQLRERGLEKQVSAKTGLLLDPYFSATKLHWLLHQVPGAMAAAKAGRLAFGTVDCFLLWRLTGGRSHATDATNASRTALFNIHDQCWDKELLDLFDIPAEVLPQVKDCADDFGITDPAVLGAAIPVQGMAGDQQAAAFGQGCFEAGMAKSTYGTGCFLLMNTGREALTSANRLLTTVAYRLDGQTHYAVEGSIFMAGATLQWLRDGLGLISSAAESLDLAEQTGDSLSVYLVPAFTGLGAPYWDAQARGAIFGLTRDTGIKELVTAGLLSVCYQTRDLTEAIAADGASLTSLRVDGGMVANDFLLQALADILGCRVDRPKVIETTALGAAYLAGLQAGIFPSLAAITDLWQLDRAFTPIRNDQWRERYYGGWQDAVRRTLSHDRQDT